MREDGEVPRLLPRMTSEPPPGYVAFVARHLGQLRQDAVRMAGESADELYPEALTDVALRWDWFELLRTRLGRPGAADDYLQETLLRRSVRWQTDQEEYVDIQVWRSDDPRDALSPPVVIRSAVPPPEPRVARIRPPAPARTSAALRLVPMIGRSLGVEVGPVAEAAVAWWHAYEARRRYLVIAAGVAAFVLMAVLVSLPRAAT